MSTPEIQADYGGFDPKFLGVTVRFEGSRPWNWHTFMMVHSSEPDKVLAEANAALAKGTAEAFDHVSVGTVLNHELRHFHDFLLSPIGNRIFRLRLMALINGVFALAISTDQEAYLPVP